MSYDENIEIWKARDLGESFKDNYRHVQRTPMTEKRKTNYRRAMYGAGAAGGAFGGLVGGMGSSPKRKLLYAGAGAAGGLAGSKLGMPRQWKANKS